jgi:predicted ATPase/class 3 adenylate cyclase
LETAPSFEKMSELPTGTVTFLFTDIEGSTRLLHELGDDYADALAEHRRALREVFSRHSGVEVDTQGDAFFVAFARAKDALAAAVEAQRGLANGPIRVRMGLHTGEPLVTEEGYVGIDVHRAARIAAAGHGGQTVVSQTTYDLAGSDGLRDLGEHRLKDLSAPERIFQLGEGEFPPLKTLYQTNLPIPATPFLGRERELGEVGETLARSDVRLLTLTGAGGSGKTRLALQAAGEAADDYPQGVWWVPLAPVREPNDVVVTAARALGAGGSLEEAVGDRRLLLLLDNFEHVIAAAPELTALLAQCPNLDVTVTSRERLQLDGEHVYPVPVLDRSEARELFAARARAVRPDFEPNGSLDELCARLDDLPLALELAAARTSILSTEQLLSRLGARLDLLKGGRDAEVRQQTLRATIEWSYDLLEPDEQRLFARLAVFRGGCTLEATEGICDADIDQLQSLVDKSLVRIRDKDRFWMLETIHEFAAERLRESGEEDESRRRHAEFFLALAESANLSAEATDLGPRPELVLPEQDNLRAALDWAAEAGEIELGLHLAIALEQFWVAVAPYEGARRVQAFLDRAADLPDVVRARAIRVVGGMIFMTGDFDRGDELMRQSLELFRSLGDEAVVAELLVRLAIHLHYSYGDIAGAHALIDESQAINRRLGSRSTEAMTLGLLSEIAWTEGRSDDALELAARSGEAAAEVGFTWWQMHQLYHGSEWSLALGRTGEAEAYGRAALRLAVAIQDRQLIVYLLAILAGTAAVQGHLEKAGAVWGAVEAEEGRGRVGQWEAERDVYAARVLDHENEAFATGRVKGRRMTLSDAADYALADID